MMLSRIANSLFWMGRYMERAENTARFCSVQFISSLDAPQALDKTSMLESMLYMTGSWDGYDYYYSKFSDKNVFKFIAIDERNINSIKNFVRLARENARGARNTISSEAWEAMNHYYHIINNVKFEEIKSDQRYDFFQRVINRTYIVKGIVENTFMKDELWALINLGICLEKIIQILRVINTKLNDINNLEATRQGGPLENFHFVNILTSLGGLDISRRIYKSAANRRNTLEFLLLNQDFPNSLVYNLQQIHLIFKKLNKSKKVSEDSVEFMTGKVLAYMNYLTIQEIMGQEEEFLIETLDKMYEISNAFEQQYLFNTLNA